MKLERIVWLGQHTSRNEQELRSWVLPAIKELDDVEHALVTSATVDPSEWPCLVRIVTGTNAAEYRAQAMAIVAAAQEEGWLQEADLVVSSCSWACSLFAACLGRGGKRVDITAPAVTLIAGAHVDDVGFDIIADLFWRLACYPHHWLIAMDNDDEVRRIMKEMGKRTLGPVREPKRAGFLRYKPERVSPKEKKDLAICGARPSPVKRLDLVIEAMALLAGSGIECEVSVPNVSSRVHPRLTELLKVVPCQKRDQEEYLQRLREAKVFLFASEHESWAVALWQALNYRAIPVLRDSPGLRGLARGYPLPMWRTPAEAAALVKEVVANYDKLWPKIHKWATERTANVKTVGQAIREIWDEHVSLIPFRTMKRSYSRYSATGLKG